MKLTIQIRHEQQFDLAGNPVHYAGVNPNSLNKISGTVSSNVFIDATKDCIDLDKLTIVWTHDINNQGESTAGAFQSKKTTTGNIKFNGKAYDYIKSWLIEDVAAPLNRIEVRIIDSSCGAYTQFSIKNTDLDYCENGICEFDLSLKQKDPLWACIEKTVISDNWQGWFQEHPKNPDGTDKFHPRFSYCIEHRPDWILIVEWYLLTLLYPVIIVIGIIATFLSAIVAPLAAIASAIASLGGGSITIPAWVNPFTIFNEILDAYDTIYIESAGCGREHPAPLIRDYIYNVCAKCGIAVTAQSAPIFFAPKMDFDTLSRGILTNHDNPYYNACYLSPTAKRGYRRRNDTDSFYIVENSPILTLDQFLNQLNPLFNAAWRIAKDPTTGNSTLYFQRKDWFTNGTPLYDFSIGGADRDRLLMGGICFEWNEIKLPAFSKGVYTIDAIDTCGNEVGGQGNAQMNGIANFGYTDNNPNYEGELNKTSDFGGTKFRFDGASTDYIFNALQFFCKFGIITLVVGFSAILRTITSKVAEVAAYALLMKDEICANPKVLIWDGESYLNAKAVNNTIPVVNALSADPIPVINPKYQVLLPSGALVTQDWDVKHPVNNDVYDTVIPCPTGIYQVTDIAGSLIDHASARLVNYPMYFEPCYQDTLWDRFHWIDDPRFNPTMRMGWTARIEACCENIQFLQLTGDGTAVRLLERVKLPLPYYPSGVLKQITLTYDSANDYGKHIELKGTA